MYFEQFYLGCVARASYMAGSEGVAAVVDPQRDVEIYLEAARQNNLRIQHVIETHLHADFVSGHRELAARTGAKIYVGARARARFAHVAVSQGDEIRFGWCRLRFLETPGRTVESICVLVTDLDRSPEPFAVLTATRCLSAMWAVRISRRTTRRNNSPGCFMTAYIRGC